MMQQRERLYHLDRAIPASDSVLAMQGPIELPGWIAVEQCNLGTEPGQPLIIPHVLLNPELGAALVDIAPGETLGAEEAFRARLEAARFGAIFPGYLPVVHLQLEPYELDHLGTLLPQAFAALPPLSLHAGNGWVGVAWRAIAARDLAIHDAPEQAQPDPSRAPPPPILNRDVAARRAGFTGMPRHQPVEAEPAASRRWTSLPLALGLAGLAAVAAAAMVLWGAGSPSQPVEQAQTQQAPESTGAAPAAPVPVAGGGPAAVSSSQPRSAEPLAAPPAGTPQRLAASAARPEPVPPQPAAAPRPAAPPVQAATPPLQGPPPAPGQQLVLTTAVNLRTQPNNQATILRILRTGETVREFSRSYDGWIEVGDTRPQGWVFGKYLAPAKP